MRRVRSKTRRHAEAPESASERWMVSYADFVTLLFAFFVVLFASSQRDLNQLKKVAEGLRQSFHATATPSQASQEGAVSQKQENEAVTAQSPGKLSAGSGQSANNLRERLEESVAIYLEAEKGQPSPIEIFQEGEDLNIRLRAKNFFEVGAVEIHADLQPLLLKIGEVLQRFPNHQISIEGHSDSSEENSPRYPSAWELSAARAAWLARFWLDRLSLWPQNIRVTGRGNSRPLSSVSNNNAQWQSGSNRRIEIKISPKTKST